MPAELIPSLFAIPRHMKHPFLLTDTTSALLGTLSMWTILPLKPSSFSLEPPVARDSRTVDRRAKLRSSIGMCITQLLRQASGSAFLSGPQRIVLAVVKRTTDIEGLPRGG